MVAVQHWIGGLPGATFTSFQEQHVQHGTPLSIFNYNVLLPNSVDGWWTYKMYLPPLTDDNQHISSWEHRRDLIRQRIASVDADIVCLQEVSPLSFDTDFDFMNELGYDGKEMYKKGRFRPATFYKRSRFELVVPAIHKDRTLLTIFRPVNGPSDRLVNNWYVLNCHLQAGRQASRRLRQINEGIKAVMTAARKLKEKDPERNIKLIVCGDFNGGDECGALSFLSKGFIDESFYEDGEPITSSRKVLPLENGLVDTMLSLDSCNPSPTLVVRELISQMVDGTAYENPKLSKDIKERLARIFYQRATCKIASTENETTVMSVHDVEQFLKTINKELGRGSEFREAARQMGWRAEAEGGGDIQEEADDDKEIAPTMLPPDGVLSFDGFLSIYESELQLGKFWGIAHDLAVLGEPLPNIGSFEARFDRIYHSVGVTTGAIITFQSSEPCPNLKEPSDHLPVAAAFV